MAVLVQSPAPDARLRDLAQTCLQAQRRYRLTRSARLAAAQSINADLHQGQVTIRRHSTNSEVA
jgi:hypothetical protein